MIYKELEKLEKKLKLEQKINDKLDNLFYPTFALIIIFGTIFIFGASL